MPFDFILPYEDNIVYYLINNKQKKNDTEEKNNKLKKIKNFKIKFSQYIKKQNPKENFKNKKKQWNKKK